VSNPAEFEGLARGMKDITALHEAGHCAVARSLGFEVVRTWVSEWGVGEIEISERPRGHEDQADAELLRGYAKVAVSGAVAERLGSGFGVDPAYVVQRLIGEGLQEKRWEHDAGRVIEAADRLDVPAELREEWLAQIVVEVIPLVQSLWPAIEKEASSMAASPEPDAGQSGHRAGV
jgi:hypothetical protein